PWVFLCSEQLQKGNYSLSELECWAEAADHKPVRQSSKETGEEDSSDLGKTHGARTADSWRPLAPASLGVKGEICMQVKKQQLELDTEIGSKLGKEYIQSRLYIVTLLT
ncbi:hypothetical protein D4Z77_08755, partial [Campylobacter coli]